jgi:hypothetical protein
LTALVFFFPVASLIAAIGTVVTVAEILKNNGLATEKSKGSPWL